MNPTRHVTYPRRKAITAGVAALVAGLFGSRRVAARVVLQRGVTGGGLAKIDRSEEPGLANLSIYASAVQFPEGGMTFIGQVHWVEAGSGITLESTEITECVGFGDHPGGRRVTGRMKMNGDGDYPFVMRTIDDGPPGSGRDTIELEVNGATVGDNTSPNTTPGDVAYAASATLVAGDFQILTYDMDS